MVHANMTLFYSEVKSLGDVLTERWTCVTSCRNVSVTAAWVNCKFGESGGYTVSPVLSVMSHDAGPNYPRCVFSELYLGDSSHT